MAPRIAIVGAGFSGIGLGIRLLQAGIESFTILEKASGVGGVWRDNTYPGLTCDVPSHLYSLSFEPNHNWSRRFPAQREVLDYLERCADKHRLRDHIRFETEVRSAEFEPEQGLWRIALEPEETIEAEVLVAATGQLSLPSYPRIDGLDEFEGVMFHSARWDHDYELQGKRVAAIGTGASSVQFVPEIAPRVDRLEVYQRSAPWVLPKPDRPYRPRERALYRRAPWLQTLSRAWDYLVFEFLVVGFTRHRWMLKLVERASLRHLRGVIHDPELRARLVPDYPLGCKRLVGSSVYIETFTRPNVELVTTPIERIVAGGVRTVDGVDHGVDAIILGTGFRSNEFLAPMQVTGLDGADLNETWRDGAEAYLGMTVAGFPNLYILYGPNTNLGANSVVYMIESQIHYLLEGIEALRRTGAPYLDLRAEVQAAFNEEVHRRLADSVWLEGCRSWYLNETGRNTNNWPGLTLEYRRRTRHFELGEYRGFGSSDELGTAGGT